MDRPNEKNASRSSHSSHWDHNLPAHLPITLSLSLLLNPFTSIKPPNIKHSVAFIITSYNIEITSNNIEITSNNIEITSNGF